MTEKHESTFSITPGRLLSAAREARGFSAEDIARQIRLSVQTIMDLEHDQYAQIGARTFVRGYLCTYARLVNVSETQILEALDASGLMPAETHHILSGIEGAPVMNVTHQRLRPVNIRWVIAGLSGLVLIALVVWWQGTSPKELTLKDAQPVASKSSDLTLAQPASSAAVEDTSTVALSANTSNNDASAVASDSTTTPASVSDSASTAASTSKPAAKQVVKHEKKNKLAHQSTETTSEKNSEAGNAKETIKNGFVIKPTAALRTTYTISPAS